MEGYSITFLVFIVGVCLGSFINVLSMRLPKNSSLLTPSACPTCHHKIAWYDNIPLLSFLFLKKQCRHCKAKISSGYFWGELIAGVIAVSVYLKLGINAEFFIIMVLFYTLLTLSLIDMTYKAVPDYLLLLALLLVFFIPSLSLIEQLKNAMIFAGGFALLNFVVTFYIQNIKSKWTKDKELESQTALGEGDIPIVAVISALLGTFSGFIAVFLAALFAIMPSLYNNFVKKDTQIPFIPFLSLGLYVEYIFSFSKVFS